MNKSITTEKVIEELPNQFSAKSSYSFQNTLFSVRETIFIPEELARIIKDSLSVANPISVNEFLFFIIYPPSSDYRTFLHRKHTFCKTFSFLEDARNYILNDYQIDLNLPRLPLIFFERNTIKCTNTVMGLVTNETPWVLIPKEYIVRLSYNDQLLRDLLSLPLDSYNSLYYDSSCFRGDYCISE